MNMKQVTSIFTMDFRYSLIRIGIEILSLAYPLAHFKQEVIQNMQCLWDAAKNHQQRIVRPIITQRYILMNEARLLLKPRFFYNRGRSSEKGR